MSQPTLLTPTDVLAAGETISMLKTGLNRVLLDQGGVTERVVSDGRATGLDARAAARRLAARGIPIDFRWLGRQDVGFDVAVTRLDVPPQVAVKEPFQLAATVRATAHTEATLTLLRNGKPVVKTTRSLTAGDTVITFRDLVETTGIASYQLKVDAADEVVENDIGRTLTRIEGPSRVLLLTDKPNGTLARTLGEVDLQLEVVPPFGLTMTALEGVGAVVLEDVEASRLSENGLHVLARSPR